MEMVSCLVDGERYELPALTLGEMVDFGRKADARAYARLVRDLDNAGTPHEERLTRLEAFTAREGIGVNLPRYVFSDGAVEVVDASLAKADQAAADLGLGPLDLPALACALLNIEIAGAATADPDDDEIHGARPIEAAATAASG